MLTKLEQWQCHWAAIEFKIDFESNILATFEMINSSVTKPMYMPAKKQIIEPIEFNHSHLIQRIHTRRSFNI